MLLCVLCFIVLFSLDYVKSPNYGELRYAVFWKTLGFRDDESVFAEGIDGFANSFGKSPNFAEVVDGPFHKRPTKYQEFT